MESTSHEQALGSLRWRYATKKFDPTRKVAPETWSALEEALILAPSSFGIQPWRFMVIEDVTVREKLLPLSWNQRQVVDASHLLVLTVRTDVGAPDVRRHVERMAEVQGVPVDTLAGFEKVVTGFVENPPYPLDMREWAARQTYLALGVLITTAALLGVDTCPMEGLDPAGYDQVLGLEGSGFATVAACPVGYRASDDKYAVAPKVRHAKEHVVVKV